MQDPNREKILKEKGYVETLGPNRTRRIFTPEEYEAFMKELNAYPDKHKADQLRRMLNPVYHEPEKAD